MPLKLLALIFTVYLCSCSDGEPENMGPDDEMEIMPLGDTIRFASYNVSMFGNFEGQIAGQMDNANQFARYKRLGAVIQDVRPDVLVLMEFDYDSTGESLRKFNDVLLAESQNGDEPLSYKYHYQFASNTGVLSPVDMSNNGVIQLPEDAFGFGNFPGQYASAILSNIELDIDSMRTFQKFLWKDMPDAKLPINSDGSSYYSDEALEHFRLSSKNHVDLPLVFTNGQRIHALISHPTPPVFDGAEDRNGKRNHDEIRMWADYVNGASYLYDDVGESGGLKPDASVILFGDLNADPLDGDSFDGAVNQLLDDTKFNADIALGDLIPASNGGAEHNQRNGDIGDPAFDTSFFGLRIDYVLPSSDLKVVGSGVYWPSSTEENHAIVDDGRASDHLLVWADLAL